jgi:hypothetical protein
MGLGNYYLENIFIGVTVINNEPLELGMRILVWPRSLTYKFCIKYFYTLTTNNMATVRNFKVTWGKLNVITNFTRVNRAYKYNLYLLVASVYGLCILKTAGIVRSS